MTYPAFDNVEGRVLKYIFDIVVKAIQIRPTIVLESVSKTSDLECLGEAISRAMGYKPMQFVNAYRVSKGKQPLQ